MWCKRSILTAAFLVAGTSALADDLSGKDQFICSGVEAIVCSADGVCDEGPSWDLKVPQFVLFDLKKKTLATTAASGENRSTPILNLIRENGQIVIQAVENSRAVSVVLHEEDGFATIAIAIDGLTINVFGACTPLPVR